MVANVLDSTILEAVILLLMYFWQILIEHFLCARMLYVSIQFAQNLIKPIVWFTFSRAESCILERWSGLY